MRRALVLVLLLLVAALAAGCLTSPSPLDEAEAARAGVSCPPPEAVTAFNASGAPICSAPAFAGQSCAPGEVVVGADADGRFVCKSIYDVANNATPPQQTATSTGAESTQEVSSNLKVLNVYGARDNASASITSLKLEVTLAAGALPLDVSKMILRYSDGASTVSYPFAAEPSDAAFAATWIRGAGEKDIIVAGDLVEMSFRLATPLEPRTSVALVIIPETGAPVQADFKTPVTYGSDTVITLR